MTGDQHPLGAAEPGPGNHAVAVARHLEMGLGAKHLLHQIREPFLVAGNALDVDDGAQQGHEIGTGIENHGCEPTATNTIGARVRVLTVTPGIAGPAIRVSLG